MRRLLRRLGFGLVALLALAVLVALVPIAFTPRHHWKQPAPFAGDSLCNPYQTIGGHWKRSNFHAHSNRFEGNTPPCGVIEKFHSLGYDVAQVADHNLLTDTSACNSAFVPSYEHGANIQSVHFTAIGASQVKLEKYPLLQFTSQKQDTIDRLKSIAPFVVINHPWKSVGFSVSEMAWLDGYDAMEIQGMGITGRNGPWWDTALTAGHPVWCFAGDDAHQMGNKWTGTRLLWLDSEATDRDSLIATLKAGRFLCGSRKDAAFEKGVDEAVFPTAMTTSNGVVSVSLSAPAARLRWRGSNGKLLQEEENVSSSRQAMGAEPYVRVELETAGEDLYFNPVRRCQK